MGLGDLLTRVLWCLPIDQNRHISESALAEESESRLRLHSRDIPLLRVWTFVSSPMLAPAYHGLLDNNLLESAAAKTVFAVEQLRMLPQLD